MEFVAATNNAKKLEELNRLLAASGHTLVGLAQAGVHSNPEEDGTTFVENALIKARAAAAATGRAAVADDSGLCVDALSGAPGVHSARFAGPHADDEENNARLLFLLERTAFAARTAQFVCALAVVMQNGAELTVEGRVEGIIGFARSGKNGFGYDPLFYVEGRSYADRTDAEKDGASHRAAAVRELLEQLPDFLAQNGGGNTGMDFSEFLPEELREENDVDEQAEG